MTDKEKTIRWFENIADECDKLTSGNVAHLRAQIKGMAIRSAEYLTKHSQESASEDLQEHIDECWRAWISSDNNPIENGDLTKKEFEFYARHFANWQKDQMMKDAIDAHVNMEWNHLSLGGFAWSQTGLDLGDKCKLIIIKE